jgi:hypothetical protein
MLSPIIVLLNSKVNFGSDKYSNEFIDSILLSIKLFKISIKFVINNKN